MLGTKLSFNTTPRAFRGAARWGTLCAALALLPFLAGCPFNNPCNSVDCNDDDNCTVDSCEVDEANLPVCVNLPVECPDGGVCDPANGDCEVCVTDADCSGDLSICDQASDPNRCVDCLTDAQCDDGNDCTTDVCNAATCENTDNTDACDDGNDCTSDDACALGECAGTPNTDPCDDGDVCTDGDVCNAGVCTPGTAVPNCCEADAECAEGEICVDNVCEVDAPACVAAADCDDEDLCTDDACVDGTCVFTPKACPDGEVCNANNGECVECLTNADCDDGIGCTVDACTGNTCANITTDELCDDNLWCTGDATAGGTPEVCDPDDPDADADGCVFQGDPCMNGAVASGKICNEATNACDDCTSPGQCDDEFPCTNDACTAGTCVNTPDDAECPNPDNCDGVDVCDPTDPDADADGCVQPGNPCEDGTDETDKLCDEGTYVPGDGTTCTDCIGNLDCDDGLVCTNDTCNGATGRCTRLPDDALCPDSLFCDAADICDPTNDDADADGCINGLTWPPPGNYPCTNACNESTDACFDCTSNADCDDGVDCTDDTCNVPGLGDCDHADNCPGLEVCNMQSGECE